MYSICTFDVGLSKSRPKLSFGSSVCLHFQPLVGNKLLWWSVEAPRVPWHSASLTWPFLPTLLKWQKLSSKHLGVRRISSCAAKRAMVVKPLEG